MYGAEEHNPHEPAPDKSSGSGASGEALNARAPRTEFSPHHATPSFAERTRQLQLALSADRTGGSAEFKLGFIKETVAGTFQEPMGEAAWDALLSVLSKADSLSHGFVRYWCEGVRALENISGEARGVASTPPTTEEWKKLAGVVAALDRDRPWQAPRNLKAYPAVLVQILRLNLDRELCIDLAEIAYEALVQGGEPKRILSDFRLFGTNAAQLDEAELDTVIKQMQERTDVRINPGDRIVTHFDLLNARLDSYSRRGIEMRAVREHANYCESEVRKHNLPEARPDAFLSVARIMDQILEIAAEQQRAPSLALRGAISFLANPLSGTESLEPLEKKILPYYRNRGWPIDAVVVAFAPAPSSSSGRSFQHYVIDSAVIAGLPLEVFVTEQLRNLVSDPGKAETVSMYLKCLTRPELAGHPVLRHADVLNVVAPVLVEVVDAGIALWKNREAIASFLSDYLRVLNAIVSDIGPVRAAQTSIPEVNRAVSDFLALQTPPYVLGQIARRVTDGEYTTEQVLWNLGDTRCHWSLFRKVQGHSPEVERRATAILGQEYRHDSVPYVLGTNPPYTSDPRALQAHREIQQLLWRLLEPSKGFSRWTMETRRLPQSGHAALVEFGLDLCRSVSYLNSSSIEAFPGNGFVLHGLRLDQALRPAQGAAEKADPYEGYRKAWPFAKHLEDWQDTRFIMARGFLAITGPDNPRFYLPGAPEPESPRVIEQHYTLIIFNDHFHNPSCHVACAVPSRFFSYLIKDAIIPAEQFRGFDPRRPDITTLDITYERLADACAQAGENFLDLGWPSNLGGLCNAYPVASAPFHLWEMKHVGSVYKDRAEHIHKAFIRDNYSSTLTPAIEHDLKPLRELHGRVFQFGMNCLDALDGLKVFMALHHKGQTLARPGSLGELPRFDAEFGGGDSESAQQPRRIERDDLERTREDGMLLGPYSARRLREIYLWHEYSQKPGVSPERIPIFKISKTMQLWPGQSPLEIDPISLVLKTPQFEIQLPLDSNGFGEAELEVWREYVLRFSSTEFDFAFWNRNSR